MIAFFRSVFEIFGVVFFRFRLMPRLWNVWLVGVNLGCLYFIQHVEAQNWSTRKRRATGT